VLLCQCSGPKKKKVNAAELPLEKRATMGADPNRRSQFEKYMNDPKLAMQIPPTKSKLSVRTIAKLFSV